MKPRRPSLRAAIDAMCKSCIYDPGSRGMGAWREQVAGCSSSNCPLHPVRPLPEYAKKAVSSSEDAPEQPDPSEEPETDVAALLGGVFGFHVATGGQ